MKPQKVLAIPVTVKLYRARAKICPRWGANDSKEQRDRRIPAMRSKVDNTKIYGTLIIANSNVGSISR